MSTDRRWHLAWFAATVFVALFGLGEFTGWVRAAWTIDGWWGIDLHLVVDAGARLVAGQPLYQDPRFLYPPLAAAIGAPLAGASFDLLSIGLAALKVAIVAASVVVLTPRWRTDGRLLAVVAVSCSLPFLHDVMLGNVNAFLVAAMVPAVLARPRARNGIALGILTAAFAKPFIIPVLLWLVVWRPRVLAGSVAAGMAATAVGLAVAGPTAYVAWLSALAGGTRYASPFAGNHGVTALLPQLWLPVATITAIGLLAVLARRGPVAGLAWAVTSGLLVAPYAGTYAALPIVIALLTLGRASPRLVLVIVAVSPLAVTHLLPVYAAAILAAALTVPDVAGPRTSLRLPDFAWPPPAIPATISSPPPR